MGNIIAKKILRDLTIDFIVLEVPQRKVAKFDSVGFLGKSQNSLRYACNTPERTACLRGI